MERRAWTFEVMFIKIIATNLDINKYILIFDLHNRFIIRKIMLSKIWSHVTELKNVLQFQKKWKRFSIYIHDQASSVGRGNTFLRYF